MRDEGRPDFKQVPIFVPSAAHDPAEEQFELCTMLFPCLDKLFINLIALEAQFKILMRISLEDLFGDGVII